MPSRNHVTRTARVSMREAIPAHERRGAVLRKTIVRAIANGREIGMFQTLEGRKEIILRQTVVGVMAIVPQTRMFQALEDRKQIILRETTLRAMAFAPEKCAVHTRETPGKIITRENRASRCINVPLVGPFQRNLLRHTKQLAVHPLLPMYRNLQSQPTQYPQIIASEWVQPLGSAHKPIPGSILLPIPPFLRGRGPRRLTIISQVFSNQHSMSWNFANVSETEEGRGSCSPHRCRK